MASRKGAIIALAETKSVAIVDGLPEGGKGRANAEAIRQICRGFINRRTPQIPTAEGVSEFGANTNPNFPRVQTIYNTPGYKKMLGVWRTAFHDILCIDSAEPMTADMVSQIDTSTMDTSNVAIVERLKEIVFELTQRCNALKRIIDAGVPVPASDISADASELMEQLELWIRSIEDGPFELNDVALKVGRRTPPGMIIMMTDLFNELRTFVTDFQNIKRARSARDDGAG
ncbi:hypothetical protein GR223_05305 [Rhizobium leguminosarum]|uniref:hypothetical protein n=1 Tax=Rhizobium ruizarguesonis TaxID=2081791 RepID=UPI0013DE956D|nr:hypothetical protein [Rhizobium ruizarguesonis]NEJ85369.1 hypothetical protein [Rhizobium ruizarguesonis]